jgi:hypothetical protein
MKRIQAIALLVIASLSATTGILAQERAITANVPFNFTVGEKLLPAGEYVISSPASGVVQIQSANHQFVADVIASQSYHQAEAGTQLVFNRYGSEYFLHRILDPSTSSLNMDLGSSKSEKRARMRQEEAKLPMTEPILVAAR